MWKCNECGEEFHEPEIRRYKENLDGENGWWVYEELLCPYCWESDIEEVD